MLTEVPLLKDHSLKTQLSFNTIHYCKKFGTKRDDSDVHGKLQNKAKDAVPTDEVTDIKSL